jgi:hypothetical protein
MGRRIIAGTLGTLSVLASVVPLEYAFEDLKNPNLGQLVMCSIGVPALWLGVRFLRFAASGRSAGSDSLAKSLLLGIAFVFPGFVFSLPLTILVARLFPSFDWKNYVAAVGFSFCIGVAAAIVCTILLVRKRIIKRRSGT